jgi:hypothetical protein
MSLTEGKRITAISRETVTAIMPKRNWVLSNERSIQVILRAKWNE